MRVSSLDGRNSTFLHHKGIDFIRNYRPTIAGRFPGNVKQAGLEQRVMHIRGSSSNQRSE